MDRPDVPIERDNAKALVTLSRVASLVVVALIALFVWQPWDAPKAPASALTRSAGSAH